MCLLFLKTWVSFERTKIVTTDKNPNAAIFFFLLLLSDDGMEHRIWFLCTTMSFGNRAIFLLLLMTSISARSAREAHQPIWLALRGNHRALRQVITATACGNVRNPNDFPATLDVRYLYMVEYNGSLELNSLSKAIATSVASSLHSCNENGQPYFAVELTNENEHQILTTGM
jgi:hypothetical protein